MPPFTLAQLEIRKNSIGGSDAAAAVGISPFKTPLTLYMEKTGAIEPEDISDRDAVYWGNRLEDVVAEEYARRTGNTIEIISEEIYHGQHKYMTAHIDRMITNLAAPRVLECKTTSAFNAKEWGDIESDEVPMHYIIQTMHYMSVTSAPSADVAVLIGGQDFRIYNLQRDNSLIASLEHAEKVFWDRVQTLNPPPPSDVEDLKLLYANDSGAAIESTVEVQAAWDSLKSVKADIKELKTEQEELEFLIKKYMAENTTLLRCDNGEPLATWKTQDNNRFQVTKFRETHPKMCEEFMQNTPNRVLRLKNPKAKK